MIPSQQQLSLLLARQRQLSEQQKARVARRIHDEISQPLTVLSFELSLLQGLKPKRTATLKVSVAKLQELASLVQQTHKTVREVTNELRPKILDEFGFDAALDWLGHRLKQDGIQCQLIRNGSEPKLECTLSNDLFWLVHELIHEIIQPSGITEIAIQVAQTKNFVRLELLMKGKALPKKATNAATRLGWISVHDRAARLNGKIQIQSLSTSGSTIIICIPLQPKPPRIGKPV